VNNDVDADTTLENKYDAYSMITICTDSDEAIASAYTYNSKITDNSCKKTMTSNAICCPTEGLFYRQLAFLVVFFITMTI